MNNMRQLSKDYYRVEKAIGFLKDNFQKQPELSRVAAGAGMSEYHFQRLFQRWAGISPKRFLQFLTKEHAKKALQDLSVLEASFEAGLSGPGRLHDLFVSCEAMSPGEYKGKGRGLEINYGFHPTPFGECFIALTRRGICGLIFIEKGGRAKALEHFRRDWKNARLSPDQVLTAKYADQIFSGKTRRGLRLLYKGTNFQIKVWEALLRVPPGKVVTYQAVARQAGVPGAVRAAANAVGCNPLAYVIPCHRVIRTGGALGGYRWGLRRKRAMLAMELSAAAA